MRGGGMGRTGAIIIDRVRAMHEAFDLDAMLAAARAETGLADFGDPDVAEPLGVYLQSLNEEAQLSDFGRIAMEKRLHMTLCNRLRMTEDRKRDPSISAQDIRRPIFITGLPRSGSSFLLDLLAQDPANRVMATWEILQPSPPPRPETHASDPRIAIVARMLEEQGFADPDLLATHPFGAELPEECSFIIEQSLISGNLAAYAQTPSYGAWLATPAADPRKVYGFHRRFLQHLQSHMAADRWVLKAPGHMFQLDALLGEYPDACVVMTHRDPLSVLPSLTSMAIRLLAVFAKQGSIDPVALGQGTSALIAGGLAHALSVRANLDREVQFSDVRYPDLRRDPIGVAEDIYAGFGLPLAEEARDAMIGFVDRSGRDRHAHGRHAYTLEEFGLDATVIDESFADYIERFTLAADRPH